MAKRPDPSLGQARSQLLHHRLTECLEIANRAYILQTRRVVLARASLKSWRG
jgi:hypothetical protein